MKRLSLLIFLLLLLLVSNSVFSQKIENLIECVNPFIGTGGHGHTYPGASVPFGMVQLSPDTRLEGWDGCSAYHYSDSVVYGFSHTHLSGTGIPDYGDILFMPTVGKIIWDNGYKTSVDSGYASRFQHETEKASPGYYYVHLDDYDIDVELTTTKRCGLHQYTFPASSHANVLIDLTHRDKVIESHITFIDDTTIAGFRRSEAWAKDQTVYFYAVFSKPFQQKVIAVNNSATNLGEADGTHIKAAVSFATNENEKLFIKIGISAVSVEGARKNLGAEITSFNFNKIKQQAESEWNDELNKIRIYGGTPRQKTIFYTALYHSFLNPNLFMDMDGNYRGTDLNVHQAENFHPYP